MSDFFCNVLNVEVLTFGVVFLPRITIVKPLRIKQTCRFKRIFEHVILILDKTYSTMLKELKMRLWSTSKCNSTAHWNGNITGGYLCAGYQSNLKSVCTVCLLSIHNI